MECGPWYLLIKVEVEGFVFIKILKLCCLYCIYLAIKSNIVIIS